MTYRIQLKHGVAAIALLALAGCEEGLSQDGQNTVVGGAGLGAAIGGIGTAIFGGNEQQIAIGAGIGAAIGAAAGLAVARTKQDYVDQEQLIAGERAIVAQQVAETRELNAQLRSATATLNARANELQAAAARGADTRAAAAAAKADADRALATARSRSDTLSRELRTTETLLAEARADGATSSEVSSWTAEIARLKEEERRLGREIDALDAAGDRF